MTSSNETDKYFNKYKDSIHMYYNSRIIIKFINDGITNIPPSMAKIFSVYYNGKKGHLSSNNKLNEEISNAKTKLFTAKTKLFTDNYNTQNYDDIIRTNNYSTDRDELLNSLRTRLSSILSSVKSKYNPELLKLGFKLNKLKANFRAHEHMNSINEVIQRHSLKSSDRDTTEHLQTEPKMKFFEAIRDIRNSLIKTKEKNEANVSVAKVVESNHSEKAINKTIPFNIRQNRNHIRPRNSHHQKTLSM